MKKKLYVAIASKYTATKKFIVSESNLETVKKENPSFKYIYKLKTNLGEGKRKEYEVNLYSLQKEITKIGVVVSKKVKVTINFQAKTPEEIFNYLKQGTSWEKMTEGDKIIYYSRDNLFEGKHETLFQIEIIPC